MMTIMLHDPQRGRRRVKSVLDCRAREKRGRIIATFELNGAFLGLLVEKGKLTEAEALLGQGSSRAERNAFNAAVRRATTDLHDEILRMSR
jgi:hypothetical protein